MSDFPPAPPGRPGDSIDFMGGASGMRIHISRRDDGYMSVTSPDDPAFSGVLWETNEGLDMVDDSYELSVPPYVGDSGASWRQIVDRF